MKNTLVYHLFFCNKKLHHFNVIKTFRTSYTEIFNINGYNGFFMWHSYSNNSNNSNNIYLTLRKNEKQLTEYIEYDMNNILINNTINIIDFKENVVSSLNKSDISQNIINILEEKNDKHIISCGCCKRKL